MSKKSTAETWKKTTVKSSRAIRHSIEDSTVTLLSQWTGVIDFCLRLSRLRPFQVKHFVIFSCTFIAEFLSAIEEERNRIPEKAELNKALYELERNGIDPEGYQVWLSRWKFGWNFTVSDATESSSSFDWTFLSKYTDVTFNAKLKLKLIKTLSEKLKIYMSLFSSLSLFVRNEVSVENALRMSFPGWLPLCL